MEVPASRYRPSLRAMPAKLPALEYLAQDQVRRVKTKGEVKFKGPPALCRPGLRRVGRGFPSQRAGRSLGAVFRLEKNRPTQLKRAFQNHIISNGALPENPSPY